VPEHLSDRYLYPYSNEHQNPFNHHPDSKATYEFSVADIRVGLPGRYSMYEVLPVVFSYSKTISIQSPQIKTPPELRTTLPYYHEQTTPSRQV